MWNILCTAQIAIQGLFLLYPPNSFFAQNISFRMFPSLEFSYVVYMVIHVNLITAKRGIILKINKRKNIHLKLWHLYEQKQSKKPTAFLANTDYIYGQVQWTFPGFLNILCHISTCFFTTKWRKYYYNSLSYNVLISSVKQIVGFNIWNGGKVHGVSRGIKKHNMVWKFGCWILGIEKKAHRTIEQIVSIGYI